jgi:hypothetical protein
VLQVKIKQTFRILYGRSSMKTQSYIAAAMLSLLIAPSVSGQVVSGLMTVTGAEMH